MWFQINLIWNPLKLTIVIYINFLNLGFRSLWDTSHYLILYMTIIKNHI